MLILTTKPLMSIKKRKPAFKTPELIEDICWGMESDSCLGDILPLHFNLVNQVVVDA